MELEMTSIDCVKEYRGFPGLAAKCTLLSAVGEGTFLFKVRRVVLVVGWYY
jgi:hypothetical protein